MVETNWVFLDGDFMPADAARISPFDRGYLFAQSAYEVTAVFAGKLIDIGAHLARFQRTLEGIEVLPPEYDLLALHHEIMARNALQEGLIYLQASAGNQGPRDYYGPEKLTPSVFMFATHKTLIGDLARDGITTISYEDTRWARRDYKTTQLLTQTLAYRAARRAGAHTAILHEDGLVTEAASANLWIVTKENKLVTRDLSAALLPGITRGRLLSLLGEAEMQIEERAFTLEELAQAKEAFTSSTGVVIAPVLSLDGSAIGGGQPGPVTRRVQAAYYEFIGADLRQLNWL
ncbi:MAG: aminotransferase class IV [Hyphomonadaceae bacterium]|nr:aminotransferase class IV [Hyphomonadaceae bacterium]